jgi:hypothetical protein
MIFERVNMYLHSLNSDRILIAIFLWFVFPFVILGKYSYVYTGDNLEILVSQLISLGNNGFNSNLWNPASSSGTDIAAMGFTGPINQAVFIIFPGWLAYQILIVIQTAGAIFGSYFLCQRVFNLSKSACMLPSVIFGIMLPGQLIASVYSLLPLMLLSLTYLLDNPKSLWAWLAAGVTVLWLSGTAYASWLVPFPSMLLLGWFLFVEKRQRAWEWIIIICAALILQAIRYQDIIALAQIAPHAHMKISRSLPTSAINIAWPSLLSHYIDIICAGLFLYAWMILKPRPPVLNGVALFLVLGLLAEPLALLVQVYLAEYLPYIQGFQFSRISKMFQVVLWLSSAFAVEPILEKFRSTGYSRAIAWSFSACILAGLLYQGVLQKSLQLFDWVTNGNYVHNLESPVIRKFAPKTRENIVPTRAEMFQVYSTFLQPYGIETAGGYEPLYMRRYYEFWSTILEPWGNSEPDPGLMKISKEWPYFRTIRLYLTTYTHQPARQFNNLYRLNLLSMANVKWIFSRDKFTDPVLKLVHGDFDPWSSLTQGEKIITNLKANFFGREHLFVYNNTQVMPRFISPVQIKVFDDGRAVLGAMANSTIAELSDTLFLSKNDLPAELIQKVYYSQLTVNPILYQDDKIELAVEAAEDGLLVGFNAWSPFWKVEIDGVPANLFPANHAFWGVKIPKGSRRIVFRYQRNK